MRLPAGFGRDNWQEIHLNDPNTGVGYDDDGKVVARNTLVEVVRRPRTGPPAPAPAASTLGPAGVGMTGVRNVMAEAKVGTEGMSTEEALEAFAKGSAAGWQKEVKQAIVANKSRGRGRGRGVPPMDYRCPRCDAYGEHWLPECPTHGDPAFDRKRVRPPVGIPMTRLARSEEGGLVLPDGNMGTLVANEDAFAREVLGIGSLMANEGPAAEGAAQLQGVQQQEPGIKLMSTAETLATANKTATTAGTAVGPIGFVPFSVGMIRGGNVPRLAGRVDGERAERKKKRKGGGGGEGEEKDENFDVNAAKDALIGAMDPQDERLFELMGSQMLPIGPRDFLIEVYDREAAMGKDAFEAAQKKAREAARGNGAVKGRSESEGRGRDSRERVERERVVRARSRSRSPIERERRRGDRDARDGRDGRTKHDRYELDRERDRERERDRDRDRDRDRRRSGGKDDVVFTISNSKGKSGRDSKSRDRSRDKSRDKSRDRSRDRRDERPRDRYDRDRRDERRDRRDDRPQSGGAKPRSALDVARALKEKREEGTKAPRRTTAPKERTAREDKRASTTSRDSAGQPKKTGKHAPIVWTEKGVDEIVDYGDSE